MIDYHSFSSLALVLHIGASFWFSYHVRKYRSDAAETSENENPEGFTTGQKWVALILIVINPILACLILYYSLRKSKPQAAKYVNYTTFIVFIIEIIIGGLLFWSYLHSVRPWEDQVDLDQPAQVEESSIQNPADTAGPTKYEIMSAQYHFEDKVQPLMGEADEYLLATGEMIDAGDFTAAKESFLQAKAKYEEALAQHQNYDYPAELTEYADVRTESLRYSIKVIEYGLEFIDTQAARALSKSYLADEKAYELSSEAYDIMDSFFESISEEDMLQFYRDYN